MSTFDLRIRDNASILRNGPWILGTQDYQSGVPATNGNVFATQTTTPPFNLGYLLDPYMSGYARVYSSDHGDFDVNNPPVGFSPTTSCQSKCNVKYNFSNADEYARLTFGVSNAEVLGPGGYPSGFFPLVISRTDYLSYSLLMTGIHTFDAHISSGLGSITFPRYPYATGWESESDWGFHISGFYVIISTQWVLKNLTHPSLGTTFIAGDTGIFTTDPVGGYDFTTITSVKTTNRTITTFDTQTTTEVTFTVTEDDDDTKPVEAAGTQFSGWAVINPITVYAANKSGIYKVVADKTHDTIYLSSGNINTTENVAIPDPIAITGFIGG